MDVIADVTVGKMSRVRENIHTYIIRTIVIVAHGPLRASRGLLPQVCQGATQHRGGSRGPGGPAGAPPRRPPWRQRRGGGPGPSSRARGRTRSRPSPSSRVSSRLPPSRATSGPTPTPSGPSSRLFSWPDSRLSPRPPSRGGRGGRSRREHRRGQRPHRGVRRALGQAILDLAPLSSRPHWGNKEKRRSVG